MSDKEKAKRWSIHLKYNDLHSDVAKTLKKVIEEDSANIEAFIMRPSALQ